MSMSILDCFCGDPARDSFIASADSASPNTQYVTDEKMVYYKDEPVKCTESEAADKVVTALYDAKHDGQDLQRALEEIVRETGWWDEAIAKAVLGALERALQAGIAMGPVLQRAYDRAIEEAEKMEEFAGEHPVLTGVFCTVVALGMLYLLWPFILEALGFAELGPVEGSFAAAWQALYRGSVPARSVFSYLQRLGMTVKWPLVLIQ